MERLIPYALIDLFHVQIQEPANRSTTTKAFICHLSVTGDKDLSISRDQMVMTLLPIIQKCPKNFYQEVVVVTRFAKVM